MIYGSVLSHEMLMICIFQTEVVQSIKLIVIQAFSAATAANKESIRIGCARVPLWPEASLIVMDQIGKALEDVRIFYSR